MTESEIRHKNGLDYTFEDLSSLFGGLKHPRSIEEERFRDLRKQKSALLKKIQDWENCPPSYRQELYRRLHSIDLLNKEASGKLDEVIRETGMLAFNLQLNPDWIRGLLKLVDEILDQTKSDQRNHLSKELDTLKEQLNLLKNGCTLYHMERPSS